MSIESARSKLVEKIEEVATDSTNLEQLAYAGASLAKLNEMNVDIGVDSDIYSIGTAGTVGFGVAAIKDEKIPSGYEKAIDHDSLASDNYAKLYDTHGSTFYNIPPFYYKMTGNVVSIQDTAGAGYVKPRAFMDSPDGFLWAGFMMGNEAGKLVSKQYLDPVSTNSAHNGIANLISNPSNNYAGFIDACSSAGFKAPTIFEWQVIQLIALAQSQSGASSVLCAYNDIAPFFPKGNLANSLKDNSDTSVTFTASGYSNCALTGSGVPFAKTTHNGQACGIADVNGNMWKIVIGLTYLAKTGATCDSGSRNVSMSSHGLAVGDTIYFGGTPSSGSTYNTSAYTIETVTDGNSFTVNADLSRAIVATDGVYSSRYFRILKKTVDANDLTSANILDADLYDLLDLTDNVTSNSGWAYLGNGGNDVFNFSTDTNSKEFNLASAGIPTADGTNGDADNTFGKGAVYKYLRHGLVPLVGVTWSYSSPVGVLAMLLLFYSSHSYDSVGGFASVSLK
ncbi:MAG: hypothetical protein U9N59_04990 [Campylobacterota bacterium]|nr:hypothetical protein [Campylobacterota bacterium]